MNRSGSAWKTVRFVVGLAAVAVNMAFATTASAATVTAAEYVGLKSLARYATAKVEARAGEANRLSVAFSGEPGHYALRVQDAAESIQAGAGCEGGGPAGSAVTCPLTVDPLSATVTVTLGNGGSSVDAGTLSVPVYVWGGSGDDSVVTGSGADSFFPTRCGPNRPPIVNCDPELGDGNTGVDRVLTGAGDDFLELGNGGSEVATGPDDDSVIATPTPNGSDLIDLGEGTHDVADYRLRREPIVYVADDLANDGAAGEQDKVLGAEFFVGGAGGDVLVGGAGAEYLFGGGGDDLLMGRGGADLLVGEYGEEDDLGFVAGVDVTSFRVGFPTPLPLEFQPGDDTARGGAGNDRLRLDGDDDRGFGGPGADRIWGDSGRDRLFGQRGGGRLDGGPEYDFCRGGSRRSVAIHCEGPQRQ